MEKIVKDYLEFNITNMCNLKCLGCSRDAPFIKKHHADFENYRDDLKALAEVLWVKKFRILGGEPLISKKIIDYLVAARESQMFGTIGICTNGLLLYKQKDELFQHLDYVEISAYPCSDYQALQNEVARRQALHPGVQFVVNQFDSFSLTNLNYDNGEEQTRGIFQQCKIAHEWSCHTFEDGYYYLCAKPLIQANYDQVRGIKRHYRFSGIPIHEPNLRERLLEYIDSPVPMDHCKSCLGTSGPRYPHRQMTTPLEWLQFGGKINE